MVKKPILLLSSILLAGWALLAAHPTFGQLAEDVRRRYLITRTEEKAAKAWDVFERLPDLSLKYLTSLGETKFQRFYDRYIVPRAGESSDEIQARLQNQPIYKADLLDMAPIGVGELEGDPVIMRVSLGAKGELNQVRLFDSAQNKLILDFTTELSIEDRAKVQLGQAPGIFLPREVRLAKGLEEPEEYRAEEKRPPPEKKAPPVPELCQDPADPACRPTEECKDHWSQSGHQWGETCYDPITITETNCLGETRTRSIEIPPEDCEGCRDTWKPTRHQWGETCYDPITITEMNCLGETRTRTIEIPPDECPAPPPITERCNDPECPTRIPIGGGSWTPQETQNNLTDAQRKLDAAIESRNSAAIAAAEATVQQIKNLLEKMKVGLEKLREKKKEEKEEATLPLQEQQQAVCQVAQGHLVGPIPEAVTVTGEPPIIETQTTFAIPPAETKEFTVRAPVITEEGETPPLVISPEYKSDYKISVVFPQKANVYTSTSYNLVPGLNYVFRDSFKDLNNVFQVGFPWGIPQQKGSLSLFARNWDIPALSLWDHQGLKLKGLGGWRVNYTQTFTEMIRTSQTFEVLPGTSEASLTPRFDHPALFFTLSFGGSTGFSFGLARPYDRDGRPGDLVRAGILYDAGGVLGRSEMRAFRDISDLVNFLLFYGTPAATITGFLAPDYAERGLPLLGREVDFGNGYREERTEERTRTEDVSRSIFNDIDIDYKF